MSNENDALNSVLSLAPLVDRTLTFPEFLRELKDNPGYADTAAALLVRTVVSKGVVDIEKADAERRPYLEMLQAMGIPAYNAFDHVRGSQRIVARVMAHYAAAAGNGYQLRQMLTLVGGPGCGKSFFADALKAVLEGAIVYSVHGCPDHENPVNLLKLLPKDQLDKLAEALGMGSTLHDLLKVALEPCAHCFKQVMGDSDGPIKEPNLSTIKVEGLRLSSRHSGISAWTPSAQSCSLIQALRQGNRGIVDLPDAFLVKGSEPGRPNELVVLLDATEGRRIPGASTSCGKTTSFSPLDVCIIASTNRGSWDRFLKEQQDQDAFTRRNRIVTVPYNTVRCDEVLAYRDFINSLKRVPHLDPLALKMLATCAVVSRMPEEGGGIDLITRLRLYEGEQLVVPKASVSGSSLSSDRNSSLYGGVASTGRTATESESKNVSTADLWNAAAEQEGMHGLDMSFMLATVSGMCEWALTMPKHKKAQKPCVSALHAIKYMGMRIKMAMSTNGLTKEQEAMLTRCAKYLELAKEVGSKPNLVEKEYRRLLRAQVLSVFAPDYQSRAQSDFEKYHLHANAWFQSKSKVRDPKVGRDIEVDVAFLDELDRWRTGSSSSRGFTDVDEVKKFRGSIDARIVELMRSHGDEHGHEDCTKVHVDWTTIPELAKAIAGRLETDIAQQIDKILTTEADSDLKPEQRKMRDESLARFRELGYCDACLEQALAYVKDFKLWNSQN